MGAKRAYITPTSNKQGINMITKLLSHLKTALSDYEFEVSQPSTGSVYISFTGTKVKQIRIANHAGHKSSRNCWELRTDAMTSRKGGNRVYNFRAVNQLIKDFK
jgi:hypothetical protein